MLYISLLYFNCFREYYEMSRLICCIPLRKEKVNRNDEGDEEHTPLVDYHTSDTTTETDTKRQNILSSRLRESELVGKAIERKEGGSLTADILKDKMTKPYGTFRKKIIKTRDKARRSGPETENNCPHNPRSVLNCQECETNNNNCEPEKKNGFQKPEFNIKINKVQPYDCRIDAQYPNSKTRNYSSLNGLVSSFQMQEHTPSVQSGVYEQNNNSTRLPPPGAKLMLARSWELEQSINQKLVGYSPNFVPYINISETKYYDIPSKRVLKVDRHSNYTTKELFDNIDERTVVDKITASKSNIDILLSKMVVKAQDVQRPMNCWLGKLRVLHVGVMVTTSDGEKWLVHKARTNGSMDTTVTDAASMTSKWKVMSTREVYGRTIGDFVKAGGLSYNILSNNCWHARKRMMRLCN